MRKPADIVIAQSRSAGARSEHVSGHRLPLCRDGGPDTSNHDEEDKACWLPGHCVIPAGRKIDSLIDGRPAGILLILGAAATPTLRGFCAQPPRQPCAHPVSINADWC
jgi:hypothetical protein